MTNTDTEKTFEDLLEVNPCVGCPAPCCRMLLSPHVPPRTLKEVDHMRFVLLFHNSEVSISSEGQWSLIQWQTCRLFEEKNCTCSVHNTPKQPLICREHSPYQCWYKRNFVESNASSEICRLNLERFEDWIKKVTFDEGGMILSLPSFEEMKEMVKKIPIEPKFEINLELVK